MQNSNSIQPGRILVIEDERPMREGLVDCLKAEGYRVVAAVDGPSGLKMALTEMPELILLDIMMPGLDGYSLCTELRRLKKDMQILMLTAKGQVQDRVQGLDAGADDYLVKPFSTEELLARIRSALRRMKLETESLDRMVVGKVELDFRTKTAVQSGSKLHLTQKEWAMLQQLAEARGEIISRETFLDRVWGYDAFPTTRTVDNHIAMLRNKIEENPKKPKYLLTVHKAGYRLVIQ